MSNQISLNDEEEYVKSISNIVHDYMNESRIFYKISHDLMKELIFYGIKKDRNETITNSYLFSNYVSKYIILLYENFMNEQQKLSDRYCNYTERFVDSIIEKMITKYLSNTKEPDLKNQSINLIRKLFIEQFDVSNIWLRALYTDIYIDIHENIINIFNDSDAEVSMFRALKENDMGDLLLILEKNNVVYKIQLLMEYVAKEFFNKDNSALMTYFTNRFHPYYMSNILKKQESELNDNIIREYCQKFGDGLLDINYSVLSKTAIDRLKLESSTTTCNWTYDDFAFCYGIKKNTYVAYIRKVHKNFINFVKNCEEKYNCL